MNDQNPFERVPYIEIMSHVKHLVAMGQSPLRYLECFVFDDKGGKVRKYRLA